MNLFSVITCAFAAIADSIVRPQKSPFDEWKKWDSGKMTFASSPYVKEEYESSMFTFKSPKLQPVEEVVSFATAAPAAAAEVTLVHPPAGNQPDRRSVRAFGRVMRQYLRNFPINFVGFYTIDMAAAIFFQALVGTRCDAQRLTVWCKATQIPHIYLQAPGKALRCYKKLLSVCPALAASPALIAELNLLAALVIDLNHESKHQVKLIIASKKALQQSARVEELPEAPVEAAVVVSSPAEHDTLTATAQDASSCLDASQAKSLSTPVIQIHVDATGGAALPLSPQQLIELAANAANNATASEVGMVLGLHSIAQYAAVCSACSITKLLDNEELVAQMFGADYVEGAEKTLALLHHNAREAYAVTNINDFAALEEAACENANTLELVNAVAYLRGAVHLSSSVSEDMSGVVRCMDVLTTMCKEVIAAKKANEAAADGAKLWLLRVVLGSSIGLSAADSLLQLLPNANAGAVFQSFIALFDAVNDGVACVATNREQFFRRMKTVSEQANAYWRASMEAYRQAAGKHWVCTVKSFVVYRGAGFVRCSHNKKVVNSAKWKRKSRR